MAKSQLRSNKEPKKPKQTKATPTSGAVLNWAAPKVPQVPLPAKSREKK